MSFTRLGFILAIASTVFVEAALWVPTVAQAQSLPASAVAVDPTSPPPQAASSAAVNGPANDVVSAVYNESVPPLQPAFDALKLGNLATVLVSSLIGLAVYVWQRRLLHYRPKAKGYGTAISLMTVLFVLMNWVLLSNDGTTCASAILAYGKDGSEYADTCRLAREGAANFVALVSLYRKLFIGNVSEYVIPLGATAVRVLSFVSLFLGTTLLYVLLAPFAKKLFVRS